MKALLEIKARLEHASSKTLCWNVWNVLNDACFEGELEKPEDILLTPTLNHLLPEIAGETNMGCITKTSTGCVIHLRSDLSEQELYEVIGHEMVHQALIKNHGYAGMVTLGHGTKFLSYRHALKKFHGLELK